MDEVITVLAGGTADQAVRNGDGMKIDARNATATTALGPLVNLSSREISLSTRRYRATNGTNSRNKGNRTEGREPKRRDDEGRRRARGGAEEIRKVEKGRKAESGHPVCSIRTYRRYETDNGLSAHYKIVNHRRSLHLRSCAMRKEGVPIDVDDRCISFESVRIERLNSDNDLCRQTIRGKSNLPRNFPIKSRSH